MIDDENADDDDDENKNIRNQKSEIRKSENKKRLKVIITPRGKGRNAGHLETTGRKHRKHLLPSSSADALIRDMQSCASPRV